MPRSSRVFRLLLVSSVVAGAVVALDARQRPTFRTGVEIVTLNVTVTEPNGRYVSGLTQEDFLVFEDGRPQDVVYFSRAATPMAVSLLIDASQSMLRDLQLAKDAASEFVSRLQPADVAQIIGFDRNFQLLQEFTSDRADLHRAINRIRVSGRTSLYTTVYVALSLFDSLPRPAAGEPRRDVIVLLSDGADTSSVVEFDQVLEAARRSQVVIYAVGIGLAAPRGPSRTTIHPQFALRRLAQDTGGRLMEVRSGQGLSNVYQDIADELSSQYVLGYISDNPPVTGGYRSVSVRVNRPGLQARTRPGYYASRPQNPAAGL